MSLLISSHAAKLLPLNLPKVQEPEARVMRETVNLAVGNDTYALSMGRSQAALKKIGRAKPVLKSLGELDGWMGDYEAIRDELGDLRSLKKEMSAADYKARHGAREADLAAGMQNLTVNGWSFAVTGDDLREAARTLTDGWVVVVASLPDATYESLGWAVECVMGNRSLQAFVDTKDAVHLQVGKDNYTLAPGKKLDKQTLKEEIDQLPENVIVLVTMDPKAKYESLVYAMDQMMARPTLKVAFGQPAGAAGGASPASAPAAASASP